MKMNVTGVAALLTALGTVITAGTEFYKEYQKGVSKGINPSIVEGEIAALPVKKSDEESNTPSTPKSDPEASK